MQFIDKIPLYWASIDLKENDGLRAIALVDDPAIQSTFVALNSAHPVALCAIADEDKRLVYGAILRANFPMYRKDNHLGEYYVAFSPESIRTTVEKFFADGRVGNVNLMHASTPAVEGVNLVQLFIKNTAAGIAPAGFEEIEDGSLFAEYHVTNDAIWAAIKAGNYRGFSIEGEFHFQTSNTHLNKTTQRMSKLEKIKSALAKVLVELGAATTDKAVIFWDGDEDLKAGIAVYTQDENGERKPAPDGDYKTEDGKTIKVADGKVADILDPKAEVAAKAQGAAGEGAGEGGSKTDPELDGHDDGVDLEALRKEVEDTKKEVSDIKGMLEKVIAALDKTNVELRAIQKTPAAVPASQAFATAVAPGKTGDAKLDRLGQLLGQK